MLLMDISDQFYYSRICRKRCLIGFPHLRLSLMVLSLPQEILRHARNKEALRQCQNLEALKHF